MKKPVCRGDRQRLSQNFNQPRPFADPDVAAHKLMELALSSSSLRLQPAYVTGTILAVDGGYSAQ
jgi:hypothetical protein